MRQTPSPIKVAERVDAIEKQLKKKTKNDVPLETLEEENVPAEPEPPKKDAKQMINFEWLSKADEDSDPDDDFKPNSPNYLVELARLNRLHSQANAKHGKSAKSKRS